MRRIIKLAAENISKINEYTKNEEEQARYEISSKLYDNELIIIVRFSII